MADGAPSTPSRSIPPEPTTPGAAAALGQVRHAGRGAGAPVTFEEAERQCRADDSEVWAASEKLALASAFRTNVRRIEVEWSEYKRKLRGEYCTAFKRHSGGPMPPEVAALEAEEEVRRVAVEAAGGVSLATSSSSRQWLSKEKQEQLIHTAPVLQPTLDSSHTTLDSGTAGLVDEADQGALSTTGGAGDTDSASSSKGHTISSDAEASLKRGNVEVAASRAAQAARTEAEALIAKLSSSRRQVLRQLEGRYSSAVQSIEVQQEEATRWVLRQCRRMLMQVDAQEMERVQVRDHESEEEKEWRRLLAMCRRC